MQNLINKIIQGDCLDIIKQIPDNSIDLIICDLPYYKIMVRDWNNKRYDWDNQWSTFKEYLQWCKKLFTILKIKLKYNGSLYVFQDDKNVAYLQVELDKLGFYLENHIVWVKPNNITKKGWANYNCFAPITERILFYSKEQRTRNLENKFYAETIIAFKPIIEYMIEQKNRVKQLFNFKTDKEFNDYVNKITGTKSVVSRHYFTYSQWIFSTEKLYKKLQTIHNTVFQKEYTELQKEYTELRKEYENLLRYFKPKENYTEKLVLNALPTF